MTNAELIAKIKAEIEKRKCSIKMYCLKSGHDKRYDVVSEQFENILSFLSTLESEKPMDLEELEKEAVNYCFDNGLNLSPSVATDFARHFAQWGAEHLKK